MTLRINNNGTGRITKSPTHLFLRNYKFYFRLVIPIDLRKIFDKTEIRLSLKTSSLGEAREKQID